jgi:hypothetical protein
MVDVLFLENAKKNIIGTSEVEKTRYIKIKNLNLLVSSKFKHL